MAIEGHHIGLQTIQQRRLQDIDSLVGTRKPSNENHHEIIDRAKNENIILEKIEASLRDADSGRVAEMLDIRMLFSCLVDADYLDTESHFQRDADGKRLRPSGPDLEADRAVETLAAHLDKLKAGSRSSTKVHALRQDLLSACRDAAALPPGVFTLTAPTGAGKTLSMLDFALRHAARHGLRRVVMVIPFLTIIEQTSNVYRELFATFDDDWLLEHHSLVRAEGDADDEDATDDHDDADHEDLPRRRRDQLTENWDAPVIITTSVQLLESLFDNRPSACRKLHRLADSVILFDEVQTLPTDLAVPTLAALSRLAQRYGSSVVFSTATQPAFDHLDGAVKNLCTNGWNPREIVPEDLRLFERASRVEVRGARGDRRLCVEDLSDRLTWDEIAEHLASEEQVLCIVNLKKHATKLTRLLSDAKCDAVFHLSTNMCATHREKVLAEVRARLKEGRPCRLISTQCVEAGVDVDFPTVWRAFGPLDAIAQAAGRCNRNGHRDKGIVRVFRSELENGRDVFPTPAYEQATTVAESIIHELEDGLDLADVKVFDDYYRRLYALAAPEKQKKTLRDSIVGGLFEDVRNDYRLIDQNTVNVVVPYKRAAYDKLRDRAEAEGLSRRWIRAARRHAVSVYRGRALDNLHNVLVPVEVGFGKDRRPSGDWFVLIDRDGYDGRTGLRQPELAASWIA